MPNQIFDHQIHMVYYAQETHLKDRTDKEVMAKFTCPIKMEHIGVGITSF